MRPKCERGWHWSGFAFICTNCFEDWKREHSTEAQFLAQGPDKLLCSENDSQQQE